MAADDFAEFSWEEQEDVKALLASRNLELHEFKIPDNDDVPAGGKNGTTRQILITRVANGKMATYDTDHFAPWLMNFDEALAAVYLDDCRRHRQGNSADTSRSPILSSSSRRSSQAQLLRGSVRSLCRYCLGIDTICASTGALMQRNQFAELRKDIDSLAADREVRSTYHYTESGLDRVWLVNGYEFKRTSRGEGVAFQDVDGLHRAIGDRIVRAQDLSGAEFRFLRKELDLSQHRLAGLLGVSQQALSVWEKYGNIPEAAGRLLGAIYIETVHGHIRIGEFLNSISELDHKSTKMLVFNVTPDGWVPAAT
jgi:DNA-binding transcriptional regulator YiaG